MACQLTRKGAEDIGRTYLNSVERLDQKQADAYHDLLANTFRFLAQKPRAAHIRTELAGDIRIHPVKSHIVICRMEPSGKILILRVRHGHEDWADPVRERLERVGELD